MIIHPMLVYLAPGIIPFVLNMKDLKRNSIGKGNEMAKKYRGRTEAVNFLSVQLSEVTADFKVCVLETHHRKHEKYLPCSSH